MVSQNICYSPCEFVNTNAPGFNRIKPTPYAHRKKFETNPPKEKCV